MQTLKSKDMTEKTLTLEEKYALFSDFFHEDEKHMTPPRRMERFNQILDEIYNRDKRIADLEHLLKRVRRLYAPGKAYHAYSKSNLADEIRKILKS